MTSIPASAIVNVIPSVVGAGGAALDLNGLMLTANSRLPTSDVHSFSDAASVSTYFGAGSTEAVSAGIYFSGFDTSTIKPGALLMVQYNAADVAAYVRGGNISSLSLAALQALTGTMGVVMDGYTWAPVSVNLSAATGFSSAAGIIQTAMIASPPTIATITTGSISTTTLTVTTLASGIIAAGQTVVGGTTAANTKIVKQLTGSTPGGTGTYQVSISQTVTSGALTTQGTPFAVSYDSVSGSFVITSGITGVPSTAAFVTGTLAASLKITSATGAVLSQGAAAVVPGSFMDGIVAINQNWAAFQTLFDPDNSGNANKLLFATWVNGQNSRYVYVCSDSDITATNTNPATTSLGYLIAQSGFTGTHLIYDPSGFDIANFVLGAIASADVNRTNGRVTFAFKKQAGLPATATSSTVSSTLIANHYNYYGAYATASDIFTFLYPGSIAGPFLWLDSYVDQIWMNANFQFALLNLLIQANSISYSATGYALIESALLDPINAALNYGAIRAGVTLSAAQISEVNNAAGTDIASTLSTRGWYLQIKDASPAIRAARGTPQCTFWYTDGQSVQQINLASIELT